MTTDQLDRIIQLSEFSGVFNELKHVDLTQGYTIEKALWECLKATCQGLSESKDDKAALRYWLYRHSVELKAHASSYLSYSEMMATREAALWKFTLNITEQFFLLVFDALEEYFEAKTRIMIQGVEEDSSWYVDLRDTAKKAGAAINYAKQLLKAAA